jgi:hypothetical protein
MMKKDKEFQRDNTRQNNISIQEIEIYLFVDGRNLENYFIENWGSAKSICFNAYNRTYDMIIEDSEFNTACLEYLIKNGVDIIEKP